VSCPNDLRSLEVILTAGCNLRCSYCYQNDKKARSMDWETLRASLDLILRSRHERVEVLFIGGEPLLEFSLLRRGVAYVEKARPRRMNVQYDIITNGMLLADEHVDFFVEHDFDVQISFDGVPAAQDLRGKGTFAVLDRLLDRLREDRAQFFADRLRISLTLVTRTIPWLADSVAYFLEKGVRNILISPGITGQQDWRVERIDELDRAFEQVFDASLRHFRRTGEVPLAAFRKTDQDPSLDEPDLPMCNVASGDKAAVDVDGQTLGCVTFAESYQTFPTMFLRNRLEALRMGEVRHPDLDRRLAGYPAVARAAGLFTDKPSKYSSYGRCRECRYLTTCGICPVSIGHQMGNTDPHRVPDFLCAYNLVSLKYRERFPSAPRADTVLSRLKSIYQLMREVERFVPIAHT